MLLCLPRLSHIPSEKLLLRMMSIMRALVRTSFQLRARVPCLLVRAMASAFHRSALSGRITPHLLVVLMSVVWHASAPVVITTRALLTLGALLIGR